MGRIEVEARADGLWSVPGGTTDAVLEGVDIGIVILDREGHTTFANVVARSILRVANADARVSGCVLPAQPDALEEPPISATLRDGVTRRIANDVFTRGDGTHVPVTYTVSAHRDVRGTPIGAIVSFRDLSAEIRLDNERRCHLAWEREQREQAQENARRLRALIDFVPTSFLVLTPRDHTMVDVSEAYLRATATTRDNVVGHQLFDVFPDEPGDLSADGVRNLRASLRRVEETRAPDVMPLQRYPVRMPNGEFEERFWSVVNSPVPGADGELLYIIHRVEDVTRFVRSASSNPPHSDALLLGQAQADVILRTQELRQAHELLRAREQALRTSEERYALAVRGSSAHLWDWNIVQRAVYLAPRFSELFDAADAESPDLLEWIRARAHPADLALVLRAFAKHVDARQSSLDVEFRLRLKSGDYRVFHWRGEALFDSNGKATRMAGSIHDVTDQHEARRRLDEKTRLLEVASRTARLGAWSFDLTEHRSQWSDEMCSIHEVPVGTAPSLDECIRFIPEESRVMMRSLFDACVRDGTPWDVEIEIITATGRRVWTRRIGSALRDSNGVIVGVSGAVQDISARKETERKLREQASLLEKAQDAIVVRDMSGTITFWNRSAEQLYGWTKQQAVGRCARELLGAEGKLQGFDEGDAHVRRAGEWTGEIVKRSASGRAMVIEARWTLLHDDDGRPIGILCIDTDVTEKRSLEQQILRTQRIESIGTLAGGIAHDLNNVLTPIMMSIECLRHGERDADRLTMLSDLEISARRGADMVKQVLMFARGADGKRLPVDVRRIIVEVCEIADDTFLKTIRVRRCLEDGLPRVRGDATQLHQVLLNLCLNARDAMPRGGELFVGAKRVTIDDHYASMMHEAKPGAYLVLEVRDSGVGIAPELVDRIFDPFFTTKEVGNGTGLGLTSCLSIVKSHGGFFDVQTELGRGTSISVYLPACTDDQLDDDDERGHPVTRGAGQLVLVVDDEPHVRDVTRRTLEAFGYKVLTASDGAEAVAVFATRAAEIRAAVVDMMMPIMDGRATVSALRHLKPSLPILAVSGVGLPPELRDTRFLQKPYDARALLEQLQLALG